VSQRGGLVAAALAGSWREKPPPPALSADELAQIAPLLLGAGCGALAWWRIRASPLAHSSVGEPLRDAYRLHALQTALHERELAQVVRALEAAGIEAVIVKGWTAARLYAEPGLRPFGDIDVCVAPEQHAAARAALAESAPPINVDLHSGLAINSGFARDLPSFEDARAHASRVRLEGVDVLILAPEEHLALLCVHFLTHGAWRPLWLCDIAAAVERLPDDFEWDRCLGRSRRLATWISSTVALAEQLLGMRPNGVLPPARMPYWLEPALLKQWGSPRPEYPGDLVSLPSGSFFRPSRAMRVVRAHWVDPIMATMQPGASFNRLPRFLFQLRFLVWKAGRFLRRLVRDLRTRPRPV
jgi:hypothetical protein